MGATKVTGQKTVDEILRMWRTKGLGCLENGLPLHPEFIYRVTGDWEGWNKFLGISEDHPHYQENLDSDAIDTAAWRQFFRPDNDPK